jgi:hypothetical protein
LARPGTNHTYGIALGADGQPIWRDARNDPNIQSGRIGPGDGAPGLRRSDRERWHQIKPAVEHVEGHVAALMRRGDGPREAWLIVTRAPCEQVPYGCDRILPDILPFGRTIHIYVAQPDGPPRYWNSYTGNGRGVA